LLKVLLVEIEVQVIRLETKVTGLREYSTPKTAFPAATNAKSRIRMI
jgi:hypothetical protein